MNQNYTIYPILFIILFLISFESHPQDSTGSLAFKKNRPVRRSSLFYQPDLSYQLWKQFTLTREANEGNPFAEHELGLRYLLGEGVGADTAKGAYWIKRAAGKDLTAACFNYGILLINGWGVEWNPYLAYSYFLKAAEDSMPQAEHVVGLFFTEDLLFERNWDEAYKWIKKSSDANYEPAKKTLRELINKIPRLQNDSTASRITENLPLKSDALNDESAQSSIGLVFIDFDAASDSVPEISLKDLLEELLKIGDEKAENELGITESSIDEHGIDSLDFSGLIRLSENGSPETLTLLGYLYENGVHYKENLITSASYYIRAISIGSPASKALLWKLNKKKDFYRELTRLAGQNDPEASFVWYGLNAIDLDNSIAREDAFELLRRSAAQKYPPAVVELGLCYYTGKYTPQNADKALDIWENAGKNGIKEAELRLEAAKVIQYGNSTDDFRIDILKKWEENGSILAQAMLGYCYEKGIGVNRDKGKAAKFYRLAAHRGSEYAFRELKRIYAESKTVLE